MEDNCDNKNQQNFLLEHCRLHLKIYCFLLIFNQHCMYPQYIEHDNYSKNKEGQKEGRPDES